MNDRAVNGLAKLNLKNVFLYGGISRDEFAQVRALVWGRNRRILGITSMLAAIMGALFLVYALAAKPATWPPYFVLLCGSIAVFMLNRLLRKNRGELLSIILCYSQMLLFCVYAGALSVNVSNYAIPATSIVVFISLLPLSIDDRLVRMFSFMLFESAGYLIVSKFMKSPEAFGLDVMNVATFTAVGMVLYAVICTRNIREIYQGVRIERAQQSIITSIATVVEERDESTGAHILRTENYVSALIDEMKKTEKYSGVSGDFFKYVMLAAPMHDIGKVRIPDAILNKPGRLTEEEYEIIKTHAAIGADIITKTMPDIEDEDCFEIARNIAKYHHERYDGKGYPEGLRAEEIPLEARIMALADVYDALVSERVYKKAFTAEEARRIIEDGSGTQFDPSLTELFLNTLG